MKSIKAFKTITTTFFFFLALTQTAAAGDLECVVNHFKNITESDADHHVYKAGSFKLESYASLQKETEEYVLSVSVQDVATPPTTMEINLLDKATGQRAYFNGNVPFDIWDEDQRSFSVTAGMNLEGGAPDFFGNQTSAMNANCFYQP